MNHDTKSTWRTNDETASEALYRLVLGSF